MPGVPQRLDRLREEDRLADGCSLGGEALLLGLSPEGGEVWRDHHAGDDFHARRLENVDLAGKIVRQVLVATRIGQRLALCRQDRRDADVRIAPSIAVAVIGKQTADRLVGGQLSPHAGENGDEVLQPPSEVIGVVERCPGAGVSGVALLAEEPGLPRCDGRGAGPCRLDPVPCRRARHHNTSRPAR